MAYRVGVQVMTPLVLHKIKMELNIQSILKSYFPLELRDLQSNQLFSARGLNNYMTRSYTFIPLYGRLYKKEMLQDTYQSTLRKNTTKTNKNTKTRTYNNKYLKQVFIISIIQSTTINNQIFFTIRVQYMAQIAVGAQTGATIGSALGPAGVVVGAVLGGAIGVGSIVVTAVIIDSKKEAKKSKQLQKKAQQQRQSQRKLRQQVQKRQQANKINFLKKQKQYAAQRQQIQKELNKKEQIITEYQKKSQISSILSASGLQMKKQIYLCPITFQLINQIGRLPCGDIFEKQELEKLFEKDTKCPLCRKNFKKQDIYKDRLLQIELDYFKKKLKKMEALTKN